MSGGIELRRITVEDILETKSRKRITQVSKAVGEAPPQYPDYDEDYDGNYDGDE